MGCANMRLISGFIGINFENGNLIRPFFVSYGIKSQIHPVANRIEASISSSR